MGFQHNFFYRCSMWLCKWIYDWNVGFSYESSRICDLYKNLYVFWHINERTNKSFDSVIDTAIVTSKDDGNQTSLSCMKTYAVQTLRSLSKISHLKFHAGNVIKRQIKNIKHKKQREKKLRILPKTKNAHSMLQYSFTQTAKPFMKIN